MALMNPKEKEEKEEEEISRMQTDVTDEEMALRYKQTDLSLHPHEWNAGCFPLSSLFRL